VLEEAVDVPACNLVVCFDEPANLKSFVQRRGRARTMQSRLILMQNKESNRLEEFHRLELEMKRLYADDMRKLKELQEIEDTASYEPRELLIENTG
jgi:ERCC4-related helicase